MNLSIRLKSICNMVDKCHCIADIGTDHGYIPVYLVENGICNKAIASDINEGPINKAKINIESKGLEHKIDCRLGNGLNTIVKGEADEVIIAGMGGNLIRDIINENMDILKTSKSFILQPVQNAEVLRKYIYDMGFNIIDEDLCIDENIFYEIIKIEYNSHIVKLEPILYEVSDRLLKKRHPLIVEFMKHKINKYKNILGYIKDEGISSQNRKREINSKIVRLQELIECISK
ncbi:tRNA (adenine(22)-N(1))-methyltransferase [Clostridium sp.]|jgi:tRNA (adenine22-N1)-methyltransferase|uniref:tRNA (adenine(22)-N(1))-methyltransferase n=1 Tax=Clostridium sp. TaxID=1506 RepID=UPI003A5BD12A